MAGKKINELVQANAVSDNDLFIVETANGTCSVPYSKIKSNGGNVSFNGTGSNSTAVGDNANASDFGSIAVGCSANANGSTSIAVGYSARANIDYSIAVGYSANASGDFGSSFGFNANASGSTSIAVGFNANASGSGSTAVGDSANASGSNSTAVGDNARANGSSSIAVGYSARANIDCSTAVGYGANASGSGSTAVGENTRASGDYSTAVGCSASTTNANSIQLGDAANLSSITAKVPITTTSDERDKSDIKEIDDSALEFLNKVKAIRYVFNGRKLYINNKNLSDEEKERLNTYGMCEYDREAHAQGTKKGNRIRVGVSAQNVQQALIDVFGNSGYANLVNDNLFDYNSDDIPEGVESQLAVNYEGFIPFLIKAVQKLDARVKELENK